MGFSVTPAPKRQDDPSIPGDGILHRVLNEESWAPIENGVRRVASHAFKDTHNFETSCFFGVPLQFIRRHFPGKLVCSVRAGVVRNQGFIISRAPEEFEGNPAHVVLCAPGGLRRKEADRRWAKISENATILLDPIQESESQ